MVDFTFTIVGTEPFYNNFNYRSDSIRDIHEYVEDVWETYIEDGSGSYSATFNIDTETAIPASAFNTGSGGDLWDRADEADDWLQNRLAYNYNDVIMVCHYWPYGSMNGAAQEVAGTSENKVAILNTYNADSMIGPMGSQGPKGVMAHELCHMFIEEGSGSSEHYPFVLGNGDTSLMYDGNIESWCSNFGSADDVVKDISSCTESKMKSWIEDNYYI